MPEIKTRIKRGETTEAGAASAWVTVDGQRYDLIGDKIEICESGGAWGGVNKYVCGTMLYNAQTGNHVTGKEIEKLGLMSDREIKRKAQEIYEDYVRPKIQKKDEKKSRRKAA